MTSQPNSVNELVAAFNRLPSKPVRRAALIGILDQLKQEELHEACIYIQGYDKRFDMLSSLPVELVMQVATNLDYMDIIAAQRVSKQWYYLFSSERFCQIAFNRSFPFAFTGIDVVGSSWRAKFGAYARRKARLDTGRPTSRKTFRAQSLAEPVGYEMSNLIDYRCGRLAFTLEDGDIPHSTIRVIDIHSGEEKVYRAESRESLYTIRLSDVLIVALSIRGICRIWNLRSDDEGPYEFRFPSTFNRHSILTAGDMVLVVFWPRENEQRLYAWQAKQGHSTLHDIRIPKDVQSILMCPDESCIILSFEDAHPARVDLQRGRHSIRQIDTSDIDYLWERVTGDHLPPRDGLRWHAFVWAGDVGYIYTSFMLLQPSLFELERQGLAGDAEGPLQALAPCFGTRYIAEIASSDSVIRLRVSQNAYAKHPTLNKIPAKIRCGRSWRRPILHADDLCFVAVLGTEVAVWRFDEPEQAG